MAGYILQASTQVVVSIVETHDHNQVIIPGGGRPGGDRGPTGGRPGADRGPTGGRPGGDRGPAADHAAHDDVIVQLMLT